MEDASDEQRSVFVDDFVDVPAPLAEICAELVCGDELVKPLATAAEGEAGTRLVRVGPTWVAGALKREVRASFGGCHPRGDGFVLWLRWEAVELRQLFPVLDGDLEVAPLGPDSCRIRLSASYNPPLGLLGRGLDRALLHRLARSTVRSFLQQLASALVRSDGRQQLVPPEM